MRLARARRLSPLGYLRHHPASLIVFITPAQLVGMWLAVLWADRVRGPLGDFEFLAVAFAGGMVGALALLVLYAVALRNRG